MSARIAIPWPAARLIDEVMGQVAEHARAAHGVDEVAPGDWR